MLTETAPNAVDLDWPLTVEQTGLSQSMLEDLLCRQLLEIGVSDIQLLSRHTAMSSRLLESMLSILRSDARIEVKGPAQGSQSLRYELTEAGQTFARAARERSGYTGPIPVTMELYSDLVKSQSVKKLSVNQPSMASAFSDTVIQPRLLDRLGAAMHSGKAIFIYGHAGTGKTYICKRLIRIVDSAVLIPHAVVAGDSIVQIFDPAIHEEIVDESPRSVYVADSLDPRFKRCKRPFICSGGELTADMLEVQYDTTSKRYNAPLQLKANQGVYMIDDLGRQRMTKDTLFNRWIVPMESGIDYLNLQSGDRLVVPFDVVLIFSTNLSPEDLDDPAFQRRIGHKIEFEPLSVEDYARIWKQECEQQGVHFDLALVKYVVMELHEKRNVPMLACHPRDLIGMSHDYMRYNANDNVITREAVDIAWENYFLRVDA